MKNETRKEMKFFGILLLISAASIVMLSASTSVSAAITCPNCQVGSCSCTVGSCSSGIFSVYNSSGCSGTPVFEYQFGNRNVPWSPDSPNTYYVQAYCDDGVTKEKCVSVSVSFQGATATTTTQQISIPTTTTSVSTGGGTTSGGDNTIWIIVAIIAVVGIIGFVVYRLFFSKKKQTGATYEELYRKWGKSK